MGSQTSRSYIGHGTTLASACADLTEQLQRSVGAHVHVHLSLPVAEPALSPRTHSPRYPGPYVALAEMGNGQNYNVVLRRDPTSNLYCASVNLKQVK